MGPPLVDYPHARDNQLWEFFRPAAYAPRAATPSATSNSRRPMVTIIRPSRARCVWHGTTPRACRLHCSISARLADGGAFLASIDLIEVGCEGDEAGPPTGRLKAAELRKGRGTTTGSPVPPGQWVLRTADPIANCIYVQAAIRPRWRTRISPAPQMLRAGLAFPLLTRKHVGTRTMRKRKALIFAATTILVSPVYAETCPDLIAQASRLVLVPTRSVDTQLATIQLFTQVDK